MAQKTGKTINCESVQGDRVAKEKARRTESVFEQVSCDRVRLEIG